MVALTPTLKAAGISRNQFNQWAGLMRNSDRIFQTRFKQTDPGVARDLSFENALEVCLVAAGVRAGLDARDAAVRAGGWIKAHKAGKLPPMIALNPASAQELPIGDPGRPLNSLHGMLPDRAPAGWRGDPAVIDAASVLAIINLTEIVRRTEALFAVQ